MGIYRHQTRAYFESVLPELNRCRAVLLDANLSEEALVFLAGKRACPAVCRRRLGGQSAAIAARAGTSDGPSNPNRMEAELLSGVRIDGCDSARLAARRLLETGLSRVFITLGPDGVFAAGEGREYFMPSLAPRLKNATGAGDAFTAAIVWAWSHGMGLEESCLAGSARGGHRRRSGRDCQPRAR